jgi:phosphatidylserine/phosphatidylglycerophosphate/cardiolipin synthase-like enzyme
MSKRPPRPSAGLVAALLIALASVALWPLQAVGQPSAQPQAAQPAPFSSARVAVYFSPNGGAQAAIVREVDAARLWIRVQAYGFTSAAILDALKRAHLRGVKVRLILDRSNKTGKYSGATFMQNAGVPVLIDAKHPIAHNKIILIDGATLITGSFNFSKAAEEKNAENLLVLKDCPALMSAYNQNFNAHAAHSQPFLSTAAAIAAARG